MNLISPNGIAHIQLTVRDIAASRPFYYKLLHETFGMSIQYDVTKPHAPSHPRRSAISP